MLKKSRRETLFKFAVPVVTTALILFSLEFSSWFYIKYFSIPTNPFDFRISCPDPYKNAQFFSEDFVKEAFFQPGGWNLSENTGDISPKDFSGRYFNTFNGIRKTSFQPEKYERSVYLFGGSTVYCSEVPDEYTIASQLQLLFNRFYPEKFIVHNYGIISFTTVEQLRMLKDLKKLKKGDIVIFYDGVNEIFLNIFYSNTESSYFKVIQKKMDSLSWMLKMLMDLSGRSYFARLFLNPVDYAVPKHLHDHEFIEKMLNATEKQFKKNIISAHKYSTEKGTEFFHFLQPHLYSDETLTEYEKELDDNKYLMPKGVKRSFTAGYPHLKKVTMELSETVNSFDISGILDDHAQEDEYFFDSVHVNHTANRVIAENIFRYITSRNR